VPPPAEPPPSVGRTLAAARLAAGLTVEQVSAATRVRVPIVYGIENDDFSRCGGNVYARGHVRTIARAVGADAEALVARYDAEHGGAPGPSTPVPAAYEAQKVRPERRGPNWTAAMVAAIVVVVAVIGFNLVGGRTKGTAQAESPTPTPTVTASPSPRPSASPSSAPTASAIAAVPADKVTVKIVAASGNSWISVVGSTGTTYFQNVLNQGDTKTFTDDKKIKLVIGNAGAVHLYVNGKDLGLAGADGQVVNVSYTPGNPQAG
jgi:cytoskeletal protein RodZ